MGAPASPLLRRHRPGWLCWWVQGGMGTHHARAPGTCRWQRANKRAPALPPTTTTTPLRSHLPPAVVINQTSIETVFSKKLTQFADVVGDSVGKHMGAYFMAASGEGGGAVPPVGPPRWERAPRALGLSARR